MRYTPRKWTFTGRSGREYEFDVLGPDETAHPRAAVYVLAHMHLRGHLAGFAALPVDWGHAQDMRDQLAAVFGDGARSGDYFSHVCVHYCDLDVRGREGLLCDLGFGGADGPDD